MRRLLLIALTAFALTAGAAPRRPANSLGNTKEDDPEPFPAAAAAPRPAAQVAGPCADDDTALARALSYAFEPAPLEIRVIAIEDLALLGDARALNPLAQLIFDAQPAVQSAAVRAVSQFASPRAEEILSNLLRHPSISDRLKLQAVQGLVFQRAPSAREMLASVARGIGYNPALRTAAGQALDDWGPQP
ncbi:MAG: HEAT repeat domain-containing protein [Myxococcaceae bacterium]